MHHKQTGELQSAIFQISDFFFFVEGGILCGEYIQGVQFFSQAKPVTWALLSSEKSAKEKKNILLNSEVIREFCQFHISSYSPTTAILLPFQGQLFTFIQKLIHLLVFFFCGR